MVDREVFFAFAAVEVYKVGLTIAERLLANAMQPVLAPAALVLAAVVEQLYAVAVPLSILVLAEILIIVDVMAESKSFNHTVFEHALVDESIVVQKCANAMELKAVIDLAVVNAIFNLHLDEVLLQIGADRRLQLCCVELLERPGLLLVLLEVEVEVGEEALDARQQK